MRVFCVKNAGPALLFVAGMGEKLYLYRFVSKKAKWIHEDGTAR